MMRFSSAAVALAFLSWGAVPLGAQGFDAFDAAVLIKKPFWANIVNVIPLASLDLPNGKIFMVDATLCEVSAGRARFLVAFKLSDPQPRVVTEDADCSKFAADIVGAKAGAGYDGVAFIAVTQKGAGLDIATSDSATRKDAGISPGLLKDIQTYEKFVEQQTVDLGDGSFSENANVVVSFLSDGLLVLIRDPSMAHVLQTADIPSDFMSSAPPGNSKIIVSHDALSKVVSNHLIDKALPINGTDATVKIKSYSGAANAVNVGAIVSEKSYLFAASATWSGPNLLLSNYSVKSMKDCSKGGLHRRPGSGDRGRPGVGSGCVQELHVEQDCSPDTGQQVEVQLFWSASLLRRTDDRDGR